MPHRLLDYCLTWTPKKCVCTFHWIELWSGIPRINQINPANEFSTSFHSSLIWSLIPFPFREALKRRVGKKSLGLFQPPAIFLLQNSEFPPHIQGEGCVFQAGQWMRTSPQPLGSHDKGELHKDWLRPGSRDLLPCLFDLLLVSIWFWENCLCHLIGLREDL